MEKLDSSVPPCASS